MKKAPKLRFPEFSGEWNHTVMKKVANGFEYGMNSASKEFDGYNKYIRITDIDDISRKYIKSNSVSPDGELEEKYLVGKDDILFTRTGASTGKTYLYNEDDGVLYFAGFLIRAKVTKENNSKFIFLQTLTEKYNKWVKIMSMRSGQPGINSQEYSSYDFYAPGKTEQDKIARFFSIIDKKIEKQQEKVEALEEYKKGIMQKIFSQEIRFKDENGEEYPKWKEGTISDILNEKLYPIDKPEKSYWRLGLRSHGKGTFYEYIEDSSKVDMDTLYEVKRNMLILNITFAWEHAIAVTDENDEGKLVSHRFPTFEFNEESWYEFYKYYMLRPIIKYQLGNASPGGAGRNRVLNKKEFMKIPISIPQVEEQKKISQLFKELNSKLNKEKEKLEQLREYKKGLLQQMFV